MPLDETTQKQLLALASAKGNAAQIYTRFAPIVANLLVNDTGKSDAWVTQDALLLLQSVFRSRLESRAKAGTNAQQETKAATASKRSRHAAIANKEVQKQYAVFAAKLAQSVIKTYAAATVSQGTTDADKKSSELAATAGIG